MSDEQTKAAVSVEPHKCGLVRPISAVDSYDQEHWVEVEYIVREALAGTGLRIELVSSSDDVAIIHRNIVQNLYDSALVICDVSARNPNVMFELGMRLAFDKPVVIIKDSVTPYSFDTGPIEYIEYPRDLRYAAIQRFKETLRGKVIATLEASRTPDYSPFLKHFGPFVVASIDTKAVGKEDYLLDQFSRLRQEMRDMSTLLLRAFVGLSGSPQAGRAERGVAQRDASVREIDRDFVRAYLEQNTLQPDDVDNLNSEAFKTLFGVYLTHLMVTLEGGPRNFTPSSMDLWRQRLMATINSLKG